MRGTKTVGRTVWLRHTVLTYLVDRPQNSGQLLGFRECNHNIKNVIDNVIVITVNVAGVRCEGDGRWNESTYMRRWPCST